MEFSTADLSAVWLAGSGRAKLVPYIRKYSMRNKSSIVTSAADGCGKPSSIRTMDKSPSRDHKGAEYKESFMLSNCLSISRGCSLAVAARAVVGLPMLSTGNAQANLILNGNFSANASNYIDFPGYSSYQSNPANPTDWTINEGSTV